MKTPLQLLKAVYNRLDYYLCPDKIFLNRKFKKVFGRDINWKNPVTFNEKLQWLKVYDRKPLYTQLVDKYEVRKYITEKIGEEYLIPLLGIWNRFDDINFNELPKQFVLKCTHDSASVVICKDKSTFDIEAARKKLSASLRRNFYYSNREWPYKHVRPRIIAEKLMLTADGDLPKDYKFMCFEGEPRLLFLDIGVCEAENLGGHAEEYYRNIYDMNFQPVDMIETRDHYQIESIMQPKTFTLMKQIARTLSSGLHHCRVDLYDIDGQVYFGEITFYHGSGYNFFRPASWDEELGSWIVEDV